MEIHFREMKVNLDEGEVLIAQKGIDHKPGAQEECQILMIEIAGTLNIVDAGGQRTIQETTYI